MNNKIFMFVFAIFILLSVVSASSDFLGTYKKDSHISLKQTCDDGSSICDFCNITSIRY
jgi:hypothetical protein